MSAHCGPSWRSALERTHGTTGGHRIGQNKVHTTGSERLVDRYIAGARRERVVRHEALIHLSGCDTGKDRVRNVFPTATRRAHRIRDLAAALPGLAALEAGPA